MQKFLELLNNAKLIIGTLIIVITSLIGAYNFTTEVFVTKAYAEDIVKNTQTQIQELKELNKTNTVMILELRLMKFEDKMNSGKELTATEKRQYEFIKKKIEKLNEF